MQLLRAASREARAFARLATLLPLDLDEVIPQLAGEGDDVVVLVHGALATAGGWRPLRARLEALGRVHTATFTYGPRRGAAEVADAIGALLSRLSPAVRVHLVGHSLGGLAVRWFVQETASDARVVQTLCVAAPFQGARGARLLPGPAGRDMEEGSPTLTRLAGSASRPSLPHLSIFGAADTAVHPRTTFPAGDRALIADAGHNQLLFDPEVAAHVIGRIRALRA